MTLKTLLLTFAGAASMALVGSANAASDSKDIAAMLKWPTMLREAVKTAEHNAKGQAVQASSTVTGTTAGYIINVLAGDKLLTVTIDPKTGKVASTAPDTTDQLSDYGAFSKQSPTLDAAIKTAEATAKGKAIGAAYKTGPSAVFQIDIAKKDGSRKAVELDAKTGKVLKVSSLGNKSVPNLSAPAAGLTAAAPKAPAKSLAN
jgi:uncharacterized membrane protein YkoI